MTLRPVAIGAVEVPALVAALGRDVHAVGVCGERERVNPEGAQLHGRVRVRTRIVPRGVRTADHAVVLPVIPDHEVLCGRGVRLQARAPRYSVSSRLQARG